MSITVVFLPAAGASATLLFIGLSGELDAFASWLDEQSAVSSTMRSIRLDAAHGFDVKEKSEVSIRIEPGARSQASAVRQSGRWQVTWCVSPTACQSAARAVRALASSGGRLGHQYFEETGEISIEVACGDWREGIWKAGVLKMIGAE